MYFSNELLAICIVLFLVFIGFPCGNYIYNSVEKERREALLARRVEVLKSKDFEIKVYTASRQLMTLKVPGEYLSTAYLQDIAIADVYDRLGREHPDYHNTYSEINFKMSRKKNGERNKDYVVSAGLTPLVLLPKSKLTKQKEKYSMTDLREEDKYGLHYETRYNSLFDNDPRAENLIEFYYKKSTEQDVYFECAYDDCEGQVYLPKKDLNFTLKFPKNEIAYWKGHIDSFVKLVEKHRVKEVAPANTP